MYLTQVRDILSAKVVSGEDKLDQEVFSACGSDFMSDVLAFVKDQAVLLTGLVNQQVIRTADMMDMKCVVFVRGKQPTQDILDLAGERGIVVMTSSLRMYPACGMLYEGGLKGDDHHV